MSIAKDIFAVIGALSSLAAVTVLLTLILHSAWSSYRERARQRRVRRRFLREASAEVEALVAEPGKSGSDRRAA